jgi:hypothetical protein
MLFQVAAIAGMLRNSRFQGAAKEKALGEVLLKGMGGRSGAGRITKEKLMEYVKIYSSNLLLHRRIQNVKRERSKHT